MDISLEQFHKSITRELNALQNRVRHLIGSAHWGEEGRYKEAVLRSVIRRFLPSNMSLGTGFVLRKTGNNEIHKSNQIDIIVYDNTYPVLFAEGDFVVTTPENVKGIIEVKTRLNSSSMAEVVSKATENGSVADPDVFNGIFVFNSTRGRQAVTDRLRAALRQSKGIVNHVCLGKDIFIKFWADWSTDNDCPNGYYSIYEIEKLSVSYFISNLMEHISKNRMRERWWFLYPIASGKEQYKIEDLCV